MLEVRYYLGYGKCIKLTPTDNMGKSLYLALSIFRVGNKEIGYRYLQQGELFVAPSRLCYKKYKNKKKKL